MDIGHLREFLYLAETLSFQITARHFYISQSVLSKHISAMEQDLGVKLFDRDRRHVSLTEPGIVFYNDMLRVVNDYAHGLAHLEQLKGDGRLSLSIGYLRNASRPFLSTFVRWVEEKYPNAEIDITSMEYGQLIQAHRSHKVEVIFTMRFDPAAEKVCDIFDVYRDRLYLIVPNDHPLAAKGASVQLEDLRGLEFVLPEPEEYPGYAEAVRRLVPEECPQENITYYRDVDTMYLMVENEGKAGFSSGHHMTSSLRDRVTFLPILFQDTSYHVSAMWLKTMDENVAGICRQALGVCRDRLASWSPDDLLKR